MIKLSNMYGNFRSGLNKLASDQLNYLREIIIIDDRCNKCGQNTDIYTAKHFGR